MAGLQSDSEEVTFLLGLASRPEFTLLCKAMEVQGQIIRAVDVTFSEEAWTVKPFAAGLRCCTGLRNLT